MRKLYVLMIVFFMQLQAVKAQWVPVNGPTGGKVNCITIVDNAIYAGGLGNVFRSVDDGESWENISDGLPSVEVNDILINDGNILLATSVGVFIKAGTGGWSASNAGIPQPGSSPTGVTKLLKANNFLYALINHGATGPYLSRNGGLSWEAIDFLRAHYMINDLAYYKNKLYASANGNVYELIDNYYSELIYSSCFAGRWEETKFSHSSEKFFEMAGSDLYMSEIDNYDNACIKLYSSYESNVSSALNIANKLYVGTSAGKIEYNPNVNESCDNGACQILIVDNSLGAITTLKTKGNYVFGATQRGVLRIDTRDNSIKQLDKLPSNTNITLLKLVGTELFAAENSNSFFKSVNNGTDWARNTSQMLQSYEHVSPILDLIKFNNSIYAATHYGISKSDDGKRWTTSKVEASAFIVANNVLYTRGSSTLSRSIDGVNWQELKSYNFYSMFAKPCFTKIGNTVYSYTIVGRDESTLPYKDKCIVHDINSTHSNGEVLFNVKSLASIETNLYAATGQGVCISVDRGVTWKIINKGIEQPELAEKITVFNNKLFLLCNNQVYVSENAGSDWKKIKHGLPANITIKQIELADANLFVSVPGRGLWKRPFNEVLNPIVNAGAAVNIGAYTATINTNVSALGSPVTSTLHYGKTDASLSHSIPAGATSNNNQSISIDLPVLEPATTYYYKLRAEKAADVFAETQISTFTTKPAVALKSISNIKSNAANLVAEGIALGTEAQFTIKLGTNSTSLTRIVHTEILKGSKFFEIELTDLEPSTTYYYQIVGQLGNMTNESRIESFITKDQDVETRIAVNLLPDAAQLTGVVSAYNHDMKLWFEYGVEESKLNQKQEAGKTTANDFAVSVNISGLEPAKNYFYRLVGEKVSNKVIVLGEVKQFRTADPVITTKPVETAEIKAVTATVRGIASGFNFPIKLYFEYATSQVAAIQSVPANIPQISTNNQAVEAVLPNLQASTRYYYRLVGEKVNDGQKFGITGFSEFTTKPKIETIVASKTPLQATMQGNQLSSDSVIVAITNYQPGTEVELYTRPLRSEIFTRYTMPQVRQEGRFGMVLPKEAFDEVGVAYYLKVIPPAGFGESFKPEAARKYASVYHTGGVNFSRTFTSSRDRKDYQLISWPVIPDEGKVREAFSEILGGINQARWRMLRYNTTSGEYDNLGTEFEYVNIKPGESYWLLADVKEATFTLNTGAGKTVAQQLKDHHYEITLKKGWNQVGNPFLFDLKWADILNATPAKDQITEIKAHEEGGWQKSPALLKKFSGCFVLSEADGVILKIPVLPPDANPVEPERALEDPALEVMFSTRQKQEVKTLGGLGMHRKAKEEGKDVLDDAYLPAPWQESRLLFAKDHIAKFFTKDMVPVQQGYSWQMLYKPENEGIEELYWTITDLQQQQLWLHDTENEQLVNMHAQNSYAFRVKGERKFNVHYGDANYLASHVKPLQMLLGDAYPNPASSEVHIPFTLPEQATSYSVKVSVHDLRGTEVAILTQDTYLPGFHELHWLGTGMHGRRLASGMYFIKADISTGKETWTSTKKLILR